MFWQTLYCFSNVMFAFVLMRITDNLTQGNMDGFKKGLLFAFLVVCVQVLTTVLAMGTKVKYVRGCMVRVKSKSFNSILRMSYHDYNKENLSHYLAYFTNDLNMLESSYIQVTIDMMGQILLIFFTCIAYLYINPLAFAVIVISILLSMIMPILFTGTIQKANDAFVKSNEILLSKTKEYLQGFEVIKGFRLHKIIEDKFMKVVKKREDNYADFSNKMILGNTIVAFISVIIILLIFLVGGFSVIDEKITIGALIALVQLSNNLIAPITEVLYGLNERNSVKNIQKKCIELMNLADYEERDNGEIVDIIRLNNINFTYEGSEEPALEGINISLEKGKKYALVGKNGCGKSTLARIISGRLKGYTGELKYNNTAVDDISEKNIHNLSYIGQDIFLFFESVWDNLALFGKYNRNDVEDLVTRMNLSDLVHKDAVPDKESIPLSGGEKQKIAIARTILDNKSVIICDEMDSALDSTSKNNITQTITSIKEAICLVITHNINYGLKQYDEIIVMDAGKIVERGSFEELYDRQGIFYELLEE